MFNLFNKKCRCGKNLKSLLETTENKNESLDYYFVTCPVCNANIRLEISEDFGSDGEWILFSSVSVFLLMAEEWYPESSDEFYDLSLT